MLLAYFDFFVADLQVVPGPSKFACRVTYSQIKCFRFTLITLKLMCLWSWSRSWCLWSDLGVGPRTCGLGLALGNMVLITSLRKCREVRPVTVRVNNLEAVMRHSSDTPSSHKPTCLMYYNTQLGLSDLSMVRYFGVTISYIYVQES